jgi:stage III sporulation protein SpoIIIAA
VVAGDLQYIIERISPFGDDNRSGIERTLHRISAIRNRGGAVIGLTCRVGRAVQGSARVVEDLALSGKSVLLVGRPGVGKTTVLRELARVLAESGKRVVIVDTSNEIAGDGDIPHPAIGKARRMQVRTPSLQHAVMIEAVENHMPQVIVVDEMGTELEAAAARTIAERGVQLIATAHGNTLENLLMNPTLSDLVGGVQTVTLGDEEARRRRTQKTILERKAPPTFNVLAEIQSWDRVAVHEEVARTVDAVLRGRSVSPEIRELDPSGVVRKSRPRPAGAPEFEVARFNEVPTRKIRSERTMPPERAVPFERDDDLLLDEPLEIATVAPPAKRVHPFGVSRERLHQAAADAGLNVAVADSVAEADMVLTTKAHFRRRPGVLQAAEEKGVPIFVLRKNTPGQIVGFLYQVAEGEGDRSGASIEAGTNEAEDGVERILTGDADRVELQPQSSFVRRVQHQIAEQSKLRSYSVGREPARRVTIRRTGRS